MPNIQFDIDRVAELSMLELSDSERAKMSEQLLSIVAYVSKLHEVNTSSVTAKEYLTDQQNVFREDIVENCEPHVQDACKKAFPRQKGGALEVPGVFENHDI